MYDIGIIGGGLAGLANAIQMAKAGLKVILFERQQYPFHRVCGEYISMEALPFLQNELEIDPFEHGAIQLSEFRLTSPAGRQLIVPLDLGGFGISRYTLDELLYQKATEKGVTILQNTIIRQTEKQINHWQLTTHQEQTFEAKTVIAAYGKRTQLDQLWKRRFFQQKSPYIGIKYHIKYAYQPLHQIALHNFQQGYCGISRIEDDKYCLCYLTTRENLRKHQNIAQMEKEVLRKNPFLDHIFDHAEWLYDAPKVINEVSFAPKKLIEQDGILMCGDSAGMIAPLAGNGMAMALHSAKILSKCLIDYQKGDIDQKTMHQNYQKEWKKYFANRLQRGRQLQSFFGSTLLSELLVITTKNLPFLAQKLIKQTHGNIF
ncbi:MAG: FAD-dependent monooxygenase [Cytophagales bacterium]|nr:MAG: FAD-dependent monooxygenase [Cytophagales bacterium]